MSNQNIYKLATIGLSGVGKTAISMRMVKDIYSDRTEATIGAAFITKNFTIDTKQCQLHIWDTAGQERYTSLLPMYTRGSNIILLCTDSPDVYELQQTIYKYNLQDIDKSIFVVITKIDTLDQNYKSEFKNLEQFCADMNYDVFYTSAKTNIGIEELFRAIIDECSKQTPESKSKILSNISIEKNKESKSDDSKCC